MLKEDKAEKKKIVRIVGMFVYFVFLCVVHQVV